VPPNPQRLATSVSERSSLLSASKSRKASFLVFNGKDHYDEWHFTSDLFMGGAPTLGGMDLNSQGGGMTVVGQMPQRARWIGRPLPEFLQPKQGTGLPQDNGDPGLGDDGPPNGNGSGTRKP